MEEIHVWRAKFDMLHALFYRFMPCLIYLCHGLYFYAMVYIYLCNFSIIMPRLIYLCHVLYIHVMFSLFVPCFIHLIQFHYMLHHYSFMLQDFHFCCIVFSHSCCLNTNLCCINTTSLCCIKICKQFHCIHYPTQWEVIITWSSLWSYLPYMIWNYKV